MKTNLILSLDKRRPRKDGSYPLIFRLTHERKTTSIATGYALHKDDWNEKSKRIKKSYKGVNAVERLNNSLLKQRAQYMDKIQKLSEKDQLRFMSIKEVRAHILNHNTNDCFFTFTQKLIDELRASQRFGNQKVYETALSALQKFHNAKTLRFSELNYHFIKSFEVHHLKKGTTINGLSVYLRTVRAIYNKGISAGKIEAEASPFKSYKIRSEATEKRAIDAEKIHKIFELELSKGSSLYHARNYFLLSYLMNGMSFADMAYLKRKNIIDGRIKYKRLKTSKLYDLKVTNQLEVLLHEYIEEKALDDFIFPIIKRTSPEDQFKDMRMHLNQYNLDLKKIAQKCGIETTLTSYVSRHSMATNLILSDVPINALSKMLGHSKLSTTQIYIKDLPTKMMDDYQERLSL